MPEVSKRRTFAVKRQKSAFLCGHTGIACGSFPRRVTLCRRVGRADKQTEIENRIIQRRFRFS